MPSKKPARAKSASAPKPAARTKQAADVKAGAKVRSHRLGAGMAITVALCSVAAALVIAAREVAEQPDTPLVEVQPRVVAPQTPTTKIPAAKTTGIAPAASSGPAAKPVAAPPAAPAAPTVTKVPPVTMAGCLERADDAFRLKGATGQNAPKSRSWKSGFLKKGAATVTVVDPANRAKLPEHVGRRVSVTGTMMDGQLLVRSLERTGPACK